MNCIIIEDEIPAQNILKNYLGKLPNIELLATFNAAIEASPFLSANDVDVVFLDINLPDISGLDFIKTVKNPPAVIMTTAYPDYAVNSFELETIVDYLVKPFSFERFYRAVKKAQQRMQPTISIPAEASPQHLFLNVDKTLHKIIIDDILYIESDRNYITIVTKQGKHSYIDSLKNWSDKLDASRFVQVHKSFIINAKHVAKISGNEVYIEENRIPIGRTYKQELLKHLKIT